MYFFYNKIDNTGEIVWESRHNNLAEKEQQFR